MSNPSLHDETIAALDSLQPDSGAIVVDGRSSPFRKLAKRDPVGPKAGAVLVVLADGPKRGPLQFPDRPKRNLAAESRLASRSR